MTIFAARINETLNLTGLNASNLAVITGDADMDITGTWTGGISLQRKLDNSNWSTVETFTSNASRFVESRSREVSYRFLVTSTGTGTANICLAQ